MTHPQTQDDEAKLGVVVSNEGMTFADVAEHYQENGGLVKLGVAPDDDEAQVEVMARAWWDREEQVGWEGTGCKPLPWDNAAPSTRAEYRDYATAALTALRNHEGRKSAEDG